MYILEVDSPESLTERTELFDQHMEPMLNRMQEWDTQGRLPASCPEFQQYLETCRWPFRKLEYSCAIEVVLSRPDSSIRHLDAGSGIIPLAHVFSAAGIETYACDFNVRLIHELEALPPEDVYDSYAHYSVEDITALTFPDEWFDSVTCISVLEHIPAPLDQQAIGEISRILKPGGVLFLTVDFEPLDAGKSPSTLKRYARRTVQMARGREGRAFLQSAWGKVSSARQAYGTGYLPRTPNQAYQQQHIEHDLLPCLQEHFVQSGKVLQFSEDIGAVTRDDAVQFWHLEPDIFRKAYERPILPVAFVLKKPKEAVHI